MTATTLFTTIPVESALAQNVPELSTEAGQSSDITDPAKENTEDKTSTESIDVLDKQSTEQVESTEKKESTESVEDTEKKEETESVEDIEKKEETESVENTESTKTGENDSTEMEETETEEDELEYLIQYLIVNENNVALNQKQQVVLSIACEKAIEEAVLQYHNQSTGEIYQQYFTEIIDNAILFEMLFENESQSGAYQLDSVTFKVDGEEYTEDFATAGIEAVFGVNQEVASNPDAVVDDGTSEETEGIDIDVVRIDENGDTISETSIEEAIDNANASQISAFSLDDEETGISAYSEGRAGNVVVVLDPGHDNTHAGAQANGLKEETLNLKIAAYCKEELEQYQGITVYMVRSLDGSCPYPGTTSGGCNEQRVAYAKSVGADIYVSIHNNSSSSTSAQGAEVYYPNSNYNPWVGATGQGLAQVVENHLVALGLYNRGIKIKDAQQDKYPDGSAADYYGVIRNSKLAGIPAIIIEHAFMTNSSDVNNYLNSDEKLKMLGVADATAIAEYYGLSKVVDISVTAGPVQVVNVDNAAGTALMSVAGVGPIDKISKVSFAVWSQADQSDLVWYDVANNGTGTYQTTLNVNKHQYNIGTYNVDAYAFDIYGRSYFLSGSTCTFYVQQGQIQVAGNTAQTEYTVSATNAVVPGGIETVKFAVWSAVNGQDDLVWYTATKSGTGSYVTTVPILNHCSSGMYYVDAYAIRGNGVSKHIGGTTFQVDKIKAASIEIKNIDDEKGQFDVVVDDFTSASGIWRIKVPVWSKDNQSNLYWYIAERHSDGSYIAHVDIANHGYAYGNYNVDVYGTAGNGATEFLGGKSVSLTPPKTTLTATANEDESVYAVDIRELRMSGKPQGVKIAVWSETGWQDDLIWYIADATTLAGWRVNIPIGNHKTAGLYYADAYVVDQSGQASYIGGTQFNVTGPSIGEIIIANKDDGTGQFDVILTGVSSKSEVKEIQVPVWSRADQSDLYWYKAVKQSDGTYKVHVNISNHGYNYGQYYVDVYVVTQSGLSKFVGGKQVTMNVPTSKMWAVGNGEESHYTVTIANVGIQGGIKVLQFAVWSDVGGQDDLRWYTASDMANGVWSADIPIVNHKTAGIYRVDAYAQNAAGNSTFMGGTSFTVSGISCGGISIINKDEGSSRFDVKIDSVTAASGISEVKVPVWSKPDQSDLYWYIARIQSDGSYIANISIANHNYNYGTYYADVYATAENGVVQFIGGKNVDMNMPTAQITASGTVDQTRYSLTASNVGLAGGVQSVRFAVWSAEGWQDDLIWYNGSNTMPGTWTVNAAIANHRTAGLYYADVYAQNMGGTSVYLGGVTFKVDGPTASSVQLFSYSEADGTFGVQVNGVQSVAGIANVQVAVWSASNQSDLLWYNATYNADGVYRVGVDIRNHQNNTGKYHADAYVTDSNGIKIFAGGITCSMINVTNVYHPVMGSTSVTVKQMADYYKASAYYPSYYANTEAPTIEAFCRIYVEECQAEGVKAEVAFCQAMKETGFLKFGGNVSITQFNFAGLGSTGPGVPGESYPDVRTGIRAQVQHLKAYGCADPLNQACVDSRFKYVTRNTAPYVEWLGIQENPYGKGWATAKNYGYDIVRMVNNLKMY